MGYIEGVFNWLDDILIASTIWEEHLATLTLVLTRLLAAGLSVNFAKCIFGSSSQEFLGMIINNTGLHPAPTKSEAIASMPRPQTVEELRTFLGLTGYLGQFVPNYSLTTASLTDIIRNKDFALKRGRKIRIVWGVEEEQAFQSLRSTLASPTVFPFPDLDNTFEFHTDAGTVGAGAVLMQTIDGVSRVLAFASHRFSRTDARRGPTERECMGVLWAVDHFRPYLAGRQFKVVTDCSAITWRFRSRELCPMLHRWALRLAEYDILLKWRAGVQHVEPDALSRLPHVKDTPVDVDDSFPDDFTSEAPSDFLGPRGPSLGGVWLAEIDAVGGAGTDSGDSLSELSPAPPAHDTNDTRLLALRTLPFATCAVLNADSVTLRRGSRARTPSVRIRPLGDAQLPPMEQ